MLQDLQLLVASGRVLVEDDEDLPPRFRAIGGPLDRGAYDAGYRGGFCVGDLVLVGRPSGVNAANACAIVVEHYRLNERGVERDGWTLLFEDGRADGFSPRDCELFQVRKVGHEPRLSAYRFVSMPVLAKDFRGGVFQCVWRNAGRDAVIDSRD